MIIMKTDINRLHDVALGKYDGVRRRGHTFLTLHSIVSSIELGDSHIFYKCHIHANIEYLMDELMNILNDFKLDFKKINRDCLCVGKSHIRFIGMKQFDSIVKNMDYTLVEMENLT